MSVVSGTARAGGADVDGVDRPSETEDPPHPGAADPPEAAAGHDRPTGLPRAVVVLLGAAALVVALAGAQATASLLGPTFLAITLVITVAPMQQWLLARRVPSAVVVALSVVVLYALVLGLLAALAFSVTQLVSVLPDYFDRFETLYTDAVAGLDGMGVSDEVISSAVSAVNPSSLFSLASGFLQGVLNGVTSAGTIVVLLVAIILFLSVDALSAPRRMALAAAGSHSLLVDAMADFAAGVRRYWLVTTIFGAIVAALDVAALLWLGVPLAVTWGLLAFITNFIPNVGFVIGLVPPALIAVLEGGLGLGIAVVVVYTVLNVVIQTIIQPRFTGDAVGLTSTVAFLSLLFWAFVLGPLGALLAIPASSFVKAVLVDADPDARWVNAIVASNPVRRVREPVRRRPGRRPRHLPASGTTGSAAPGGSAGSSGSVRSERSGGTGTSDVPVEAGEPAGAVRQDGGPAAGDDELT